MEILERLDAYREEPLTRQLVLSILEDYKRPNDKISELIKAGWLTSLKNGVYIPGPKSKLPQPESLLIANHLWGPSYVSMETALSHWGLIPERVFETSSLTIKASKTYQTPIGRFSYRQAPLPYYSFGITCVDLSPKQSVLIATREKALCDKIIMTAGINLRSIRQTLELLTEDWRIDEDRLAELDIEAILSWIPDAPKQTSLQMLVQTLQRL